MNLAMRLILRRLCASGLIAAAALLLHAAGV
jgi:hypothetical protein